MPMRSFAVIGVVEVQKSVIFCDYQHARTTLYGDWRGRGAKIHVFLRFSRCSRNPLRGLAWSRCKNPWFFCDLCGVRVTLCGDRRGRGVKTRGVLRLLFFELILGNCLVVRALAPGIGGSRVRFLLSPRAGVARCNLHFKAICVEQFAQSSNLRRASCIEQFAQTNLHRPVCAERFA